MGETLRKLVLAELDEDIADAIAMDQDEEIFTGLLLQQARYARWSEKHLESLIREGVVAYPPRD